MSVRLDTSAAGARSGTIAISLASDGTGTSGLGVTALPSQNVTVQGNVYNLAVGSATPDPIAIANQRVGGTGSQALTIANTAAAGAFSEALNASLSTTGAATGSGSALNIAAGANSTALSVGVNT